MSVSPNWSNSDQFSQELRVEAPRNDLIDAQAGVFYYYRKGQQFFQTHGTFARTPALPAGSFYSFSGGLQHDQARKREKSQFTRSK